MMRVLVCSVSVGISLALCNETLSKENEKATKRQVKTFQVKTNQGKEQKFFNTGKKQCVFRWPFYYAHLFAC